MCFAFFIFIAILNNHGSLNPVHAFKLSLCFQTGKTSRLLYHAAGKSNDQTHYISVTIACNGIIIQSPSYYETYVGPGWFILNIFSAINAKQMPTYRIRLTTTSNNMNHNIGTISVQSRKTW